MAKIRNYVTDNNITDQDIVVGSDGDNSGVTKNFNVSALKDYILQSDDNVKAKWGEIVGNISEQGDLDSALYNKVDKIVGKGLSTNDYTTTEKNKLDGIQAGAEVNVNADWNAVTGDAVILNKPIVTIPNLQQVTEEGNLTEEAIIADDLASKPSYISNFASALSYSGNGSNAKGVLILREFSGGDGFISSLSSEILTSNRNLTLPDKNGILATISDISSIDSIPTNGSSNAVSSDGVFDALALKADLVTGKVPSSQLPSYVDDVIEGYYSAGVFYSNIGLTTPITGETGKIYIDLLMNQSYRWSGSIYVQISNAISTLDELTDVVISGVSNGQLLQYNTTTSKWENQSIVVPTKTSDLINDGDNGTSHFISLEDLPSTLTVYPTTVASGIGGYNKLVSSITDPDYNTTAVDVSTGAITGTDQLIAGLITDQNQIIGNPGIFNITTLGNIRKTAGSGQAEFFFRVYKRDSGGTETLILQSSNTQPITSAIYAEFFTSGLWNDGIFVLTDRIVIKFYGTKVGSGSNPTYYFQFGGSNPVRSIIPVPLNVIPVIKLDDLQDATITSPANNEVLTYESSTSLWKNKIISQGVPITRQQFYYSGSQSFTLSSTPSSIIAVFVRGVEQREAQYSVVGTTLTISDTLESADRVVILYTPVTVGILEYYTKSEIDAFGYEGGHPNFVEVNDISDLPTPVSNVYNLVGGYTYLFLKHIDLVGGRIVCGQDTVIVGWSSENCSISSTGLSSATALITSTYSLPIRNISFTHDLVFDLQGDGVTTALDWFGVNLLNCASGGTIKNYTNFVAGDSALLNSGGFIFDGTLGTSAFSNCLFDVAPGKTAITVLSTCTISRRMRIIYSSFVVLSGETGINFSTSATVGDEKYILDTVNFSGGGTYISGFDATSNKSLFSNCVGITNTSTRGFLHMLDNITATSITGTASYFKAAGTTTAMSTNSKFTMPSSNRLTYTGAFTQSFFVSLNCNVRTSVSTQNINIVIAKNGTIMPESEMTILCAAGSTPSFGGTQVAVELTANDYIELYVRNTSSVNNVTVVDLNMNVFKIPV